MLNIFISFEDRDRSLAELFRLQLQYGEQQIRFHPMVLNLELLFGDYFEERALVFLIHCHHVILILSEDFLRSSWMLRELAMFLKIERMIGSNNFIIPVIASDCMMPIELINRAYVDARNLDREEVVRQVIEIMASIQPVQRYSEETSVVVLDPDLTGIFPNSESVNEALRALVQVGRQIVKEASS